MKNHTVLHVLELAVVAALIFSIGIAINTKYGKNPETHYLLEPSPFSGHLYSIADVEKDLDGLGCRIVAFTHFYEGAAIFYLSNYTDFRTIAYNTNLVLMKIEQDTHGRKEIVHMFAIFDGALIQHSIQFDETSSQNDGEGQPPDGEDQSSGSENLGVMSISKYNATAYLVQVKNWGTVNATVAKVRIAGSAHDTGWKTLTPITIKPGASRILDTGNVGVNFSVGDTVTVTVQTTLPSDFPNTLSIEG